MLTMTLLGGLLLGVASLPAIVQVPRRVYEAQHASRIFDEILGPAAGHLTLDCLDPQNGGLLGLPLAPSGRCLPQP
jgi:hypothetical protein